MERVARGGPIVLAALLALRALLVAMPASALEGRGYLELDGGFKTGDFGTSTDSSLFSVSPTLGYVTARYDVAVTAPFHTLVVKTAGERTTETGLGDVVLRAGAVLIPETGGFSCSGAAALKLPTADEADGLGTGELDYGVFAGVHQRLARFKFSLNGGYIVTGNPSGIGYEDVVLAGIAVSRVFGRTNVFASLEGRENTVPGAEGPREASLGAFHLLSDDYALTGSVTFGLNDGGPAFGALLGIVRWL